MNWLEFIASLVQSLAAVFTRRLSIRMTRPGQHAGAGTGEPTLGHGTVAGHHRLQVSRA